MGDGPAAWCGARERVSAPKDSSDSPTSAAYSLVLASYGFANLAANVVIGSMPVLRPVPLMFAASIVLGLGIIGMGAAITFAFDAALVPVLMLAAQSGRSAGDV